MYLDMGEKEDNTTAERWQGDAEGIFYFVSPCSVIHAHTSMN
jgi:hypothetical protein